MTGFLLSVTKKFMFGFLIIVIVITYNKGHDWFSNIVIVITYNKRHNGSSNYSYCNHLYIKGHDSSSHFYLLL